MASKPTNIGFILPVESVSRKFARRADKVNGSVTGVKVWIGAAESSIPTKAARNMKKNYIVVRKFPRSTPVTQHERDIRIRFAAVSQAVAERAQDLTQITQDQIAFQAQLNTPGCVYSMKAYLWKLECTKYDAAHPQG